MSANVTSSAAAARAPVTGRHGPLSPLQQRYVAAATGFHSNFNVVMAWRIRGQLDDAMLQSALDGLVARHEALRSRLTVGPHGLAQHAEPPSAVAIERRRPLDAGRDEESLGALLCELADRPFDLLSDRLLRVVLLPLASADRLLVVVVPHVLCDAWSCDVLLREFRALCRARPDPLPPVALQQLDHAAATAQPVDAATESFWRVQLGAPSAGVALPPPAGWEWTAKAMQVERMPTVTPKVTAAARRCAREARTSLMGILLTAVADALRARSRDTVTLAVMHANRFAPESASAVGLLSDFLPLRISVVDDPTPRQLLDRVRRGWLEALAHPRPFGAIGAALGREPEWPASRLFDFTVNFTPSWPSGTDQTASDGPAITPCTVPNTRRDVRIARWPSGSFPAEFQIRQAADDSLGLCMIRVGNALSREQARALAGDFHVALHRLVRR